MTAIYSLGRRCNQEAMGVSNKAQARVAGRGAFKMWVRRVGIAPAQMPVRMTARAGS
jgi:hypothetical protein